jgi:hypothetical protein
MNPSEGRGSGPFRSLGRIRRKGLTRGAIIGWFAALLGAASGAAALGDNSFFTHLATGRRILDGHLPSTDPYSFSAHGHSWVIQSWFASLLYGLGDKVGHGLGIRLMVAVLSALLAVLLWRLTRPAGSIVARLAAVAPALVIGQVSWGARPLIFGLVGFALVLVWLREERDPRWLVPVMWVWVNTHGSFPMGLVLIVAYGIGPKMDGHDLGQVRRTFAWCVGGTVLGAVNPLGPKLLWFPVQLLSKQDVLNRMVEWQAPGFGDTWQRLFLLMFLVAMALVPRLPRDDRYRLLLPTLLFSALGFVAMRNIALATFLLAVLVATELSGLGSLSGKVRSHVYTLVSGAMVVLIVLLVAIRLSQPSFDYSAYPVAAVDYLGTHGRLGPDHHLMAQDFVGNYLTLRGGGKIRIFVDDRVDMYPKKVLDDETTLLAGGPRWQRALDRWKIDTVLWERSKPLATLLSESSDWKLVRTDAKPHSTAWVVYERVTGGGR